MKTRKREGRGALAATRTTGVELKKKSKESSSVKGINKEKGAQDAKRFSASSRNQKVKGGGDCIR